MSGDVEAQLDRAAAAISGASVVALACHVWPDGDALGSMLALHHLAGAHGRPSVASWPEPQHVAPHYAFLPGLDSVTKAADFPSAPEVMVTFDSGSLDRLGSLVPAARAAGELIVVDHHASNTRYGSINVIDPDAAATAVIVRALARRLGWALTRDAALCIYTGLVTDTGRFQYANTTPEVFALAEELAEFDLPIAFMTRELFEKHRFSYLRLVSDVLARAELDPETGMVFAWVTQDDLARHGVGLDETEGLIDLVRRTAEARVAMVAKESPDGVRVSLRSVDETDVGVVATALGGGGHRFASGFVWPGTVADAARAVRRSLAAGG
ncbi:MAG TPA: bifunctional oligoribonuclease/PAP phosphatase NrnA [Acidimicrobiales bacterium]|nr:bifunctional oligoribonuclease/PAP phosphatase NrnA [Acidimicrobiales bacterium]